MNDFMETLGTLIAIGIGLVLCIALLCVGAMLIAATVQTIRKGGRR